MAGAHADRGDPDCLRLQQVGERVTIERLAIVSVLALVLVTSAAAQEPRFEVASLKADTRDIRSLPPTANPGPGEIRLVPGFYAMTFRFLRTPVPAGVSPSLDEAPSVFTALPEQLGLKLEPATTTGQILVIDHIERPTED